MAEADETMFDVTLKKKKKKTKKLVALDDDDMGGESTTDAAPAPAPAPTADAGDGGDDFLLGAKKKKKKKKKTFDIDAAEAEQDAAAMAVEVEVANEADAMLEAAAPQVAVEELGELALELAFPLKKKRKRTEKIPEEYAENAGFLMVEEEVEVKALSKDEDTAAWAGSNRDYHYTELLERVFDIMRAKNPNMLQGEKRRFVMKPPSVIRVGSRKSGFINFVEICKMMHRQPDHVLGFLLTELGTSGTLDGSNSLILKGRFQQKQMESVLRRYIREYVTCHTCKSPDTIMSKENRLFFLTCETCGARNSVSSIKAGFSAVVGKRSRIRAKEG